MNTNTPTKTIQQAILEWQDGRLCAVLEYRSSKAEPIQWRDKDTHQTMRAVTLTHTCENATTSLLVSERVDDSFDHKTYVPPFMKGQKVLCTYDSAARNRGVTTLYGKLEALDMNGAANGHPAKPEAPKAEPTKPTAK